MQIAFINYWESVGAYTLVYGCCFALLKNCWKRSLLTLRNSKVWTRIFHMHPHSMARLIFTGEKLVLEKLESSLILFYFKRENKTRKKTLKKWLHSFGKASLSPGITLPIGKVPLRGSILLSPKEVSID